jgi:NarL family two-component system response regulator LiaR
VADIIRITIADDHPIVRQGLMVAIGAQDDLELVGEASNGAEAVELAKNLNPDVIIMDLQMPVKDGITAIREITQDNEDARILVLTSFPDDNNVFSAIKAGAMGFLLKEAPPEELLASIRTVHNGEAALHPTVARKLIQEVKAPSKTRSSLDPLTPREMDVLKCLARGLSNREIAKELTVSVRTVTTHMRNILDKLHVSNRTQAALYALEHGVQSN